jgi:exosortase
MQLIATKAAHWGAGLCGVETIVEGTNISSASGNWDTYSIAGGCSGMRSLMALIMVSIAWGYLADKLVLWKRVALGLSAIPLSIVANAFRVSSIFICAEYINPAFASKTWHDWSGLLFFFPASLVGLMLLHGLLAGEVPFLKRRRTIVRRVNPPTGKEDTV